MDLLIEKIVRALSHIIPSALRWYYTEQRLAKRMRITVSGENEGLVVNCADIPDARVWFEVTNQTPFPVEIRALSADLMWGGRVARFISIQRVELAPHSIDKVFVETTLTHEQAQKIRTFDAREDPRLSVHVEMQCRLRPFTLFGRDIQTPNFERINCEAA